LCELIFFFLCNTHDNFAGALVRDVMGGAKRVGQTVAFDAVAGLERIRRVVEAGVDDAAVARAGGHANAGHLLEDEDVGRARRQLGGNGAADNPASDDDDVGSFHVCAMAQRLGPLG